MGDAVKALRSTNRKTADKLRSPEFLIYDMDHWRREVEITVSKRLSSIGAQCTGYPIQVDGLGAKSRVEYCPLLEAEGLACMTEFWLQ